MMLNRLLYHCNLKVSERIFSERIVRVDELSINLISISLLNDFLREAADTGKRYRPTIVL